MCSKDRQCANAASGTITEVTHGSPVASRSLARRRMGPQRCPLDNAERTRRIDAVTVLLDAVDGISDPLESELLVLLDALQDERRV